MLSHGGGWRHRPAGVGAVRQCTAYIHDNNISGFRALYREAGLPDVAYPAFREALAAMRAGLLIGEQGGAARLKRRMVEHVLGACVHERGEGNLSLMALLRRFAVEAAREELACSATNGPGTLYTGRPIVH